MPIDTMKIREWCNEGLFAIKHKYPATASEAFQRIKAELRRDAAEPEQPPKFEWFLTCPWEELASVLMAYEEDDSAVWLKGKRDEWPKMFLDGLTAEHFGDCTKAPITCMRCMAESFKKKIDAMRAAVLP
jgi:hypothetical protein